MPGVQTFPTRSEIDSEEKKLKNEIRDRAVDQLSEIGGTDNVHIRDILPDEDLESGDDNDWNGTDRKYEQHGLEADEESHVYSIDSNSGAENKVIGVYAFGVEDSSCDVSEIIFKDATGSTFERAHVQGVLNREDGAYRVAMMEQPIIFNASEDAEVYMWSTTGDSTTPTDEEIVFHGAVAEKKGKTLGERSVPQGSPVPGRAPRR